MKLNKARIAINELLNRGEMLRFFINSILLSFFLMTRFLCKLFSYKDGTVVVISLHRLGDTVFTIPAITAIYNQYGKKVYIICFPESVAIYRLAFTDINICELEHDKFYFGGRIANASVKRKLKSLVPSIVFDITGSMMSASLIFNSRANKIIGRNGTVQDNFHDQYVDFREKPKLIDIYGWR